MKLWFFSAEAHVCNIIRAKTEEEAKEKALKRAYEMITQHPERIQVKELNKKDD